MDALTELSPLAGRSPAGSTFAIDPSRRDILRAEDESDSFRALSGVASDAAATAASDA
jgi:hypothetical protein